jgi:Kef-type K+ transport system membrane component KefB
MVGTWGLSRLLKPFFQPPVVTEIFLGILIGPSFLGAFYPSLTVNLLSSVTVSHLQVLSELGIVFFMFTAGLDLNLDFLHKSRREVTMVSSISFLLPFAVGGLLSWSFFYRIADPSISRLTFSIYTGLLLSVTAFPVLARILKSSNLIQTYLGQLALASAAVLDLIAWLILATIVWMIRSNEASPFMTASLALTLIGALLLLAPFIKRISNQIDNKGYTNNSFLIVIILILLSAIATEWVGIHTVFGPFLIGLIIAKDSDMGRKTSVRLESLSVTVLMPAFFILTGLRTQVGNLSSINDWLYFAIVLLVAVLCKAIAGYISGRFSRLSRRDSLGLGFLLNTRGLMELVILNIGLDLGLVSPKMFTIFVLVALVTTAMTGPALGLLFRTPMIVNAVLKKPTNNMDIEILSK